MSKGACIVDLHEESSASCVCWWPCIIRPFNLGVIGLAVAVALWSFAYKLSLYHPDQSHPARISVAKMWLGPEGSLLISKYQPNSQLHLGSSRDTILGQQAEAPPETRIRMLVASYAAVPGWKRVAACSPRSPPAHMS
jgi:hypothetical protein